MICTRWWPFQRGGRRWPESDRSLLTRSRRLQQAVRGTRYTPGIVSALDGPALAGPERAGALTLLHTTFADDAGAARLSQLCADQERLPEPKRLPEVANVQRRSPRIRPGTVAQCRRRSRVRRRRRAPSHGARAAGAAVRIQSVRRHLDRTHSRKANTLLRDVPEAHGRAGQQLWYVWEPATGSVRCPSDPRVVSCREAEVDRAQADCAWTSCKPLRTEGDNLAVGLVRARHPSLQSERSVRSTLVAVVHELGQHRLDVSHTQRLGGWPQGLASIIQRQTHAAAGWVVTKAGPGAGGVSSPGAGAGRGARRAYPKLGGVDDVGSGGYVEILP